MADYRRRQIAGGSYFFTLVTHSRAPLFSSQSARTILGNTLRTCQREWLFEINAIVLLPEHLHTIWTLPSGDVNYPQRWAWIKKEFTKEWLRSGGWEQPVSQSRKKRGDHGVWQPRYWEHTLKNEDDFDRHFDYIHWNPVKHRHVRCPSEWEASSIHRWINANVYEPEWGCGDHQILNFEDLNETAMELF